MSQKIKVLTIIHGLWLGGAENVVFNIIKKIDTDKFDVYLCCTHGAGELGERLLAEGYDMEIFDRGIGPIKTFKKIKAYIEKVDPDIVHTHCVSAFLAVAPLYVFFKLPPWMHTFHFGNYPHIKKSYLISKRIFGRFATRLIAVSESQRNAVINSLYAKPEKITTVFNGVPNNPVVLDPDKQRQVRGAIRQELCFSDDDIVIGSIVVLTRQKGITYLLQAADEILDRIDKAKILIVGGGPLEDDLQLQASKLKNRERVIFAGWRQDVHEIMASIDMFVLPSLWEGLPMVLLEAMASSLPVVVTDVADNTQVVGDSGYIVQPADVDALRDAIIKMAFDMDHARQLGRKALQRYQDNYTVDIMVGNYEKEYEKIVNPSE